MSASSSSAAAPAAAGSSCPSSLGPRPRAWLLAALRRVDAVAFDVDSTVSAEEGIDVLAESLGKGEQVRAYTAQAMNGSVPFEVSLRDRLQLMQPSAAAVEACVAAHPASFSPGFLEFLAFFRAWFARRRPSSSSAGAPATLPVFLVSGGFRALIEPLRVQLGILPSHVFANSMIHDASTGAYAGFKENEPTSRSGGKARALERIKAAYGFEHIAMIGDGATDLEACPPAEVMVGYGGVAAREKVKQQAHVFITHWNELQTLLEEAEREEDRNDKEGAHAVAEPLAQQPATVVS